MAAVQVAGEGRTLFVQVPEVLTAQELESIDGFLAARNFVDGGATADFPARSIKKNLQLEAFEGREKLDAIVLQAVGRSELARIATLPKRIMRPIFSKYDEGMEYGWHTDNPVMSDGAPLRIDIAMTVFLSDPAAYDGGALTVRTGGGIAQFKLPRGHAVFYPATTSHSVEPVTRGTRLAAVTWIQSLVGDAAKREILYEMDAVSRVLRQKSPNADETRLMIKCHSNLMRMWTEI